MKLLIWDLDDTIIDTQPLYYDKIDRMGKILHEDFGYPYVEAIETQRRIDRDLVREHGVSIHRFPQSLRDTYVNLCTLSNTPFDPDTCDMFKELGYSLYNEVAENLPFVDSILKYLYDQNYTMVILTKGDNTVQRRRAASTGLLEYFKEVFVVDVKTPETYRGICRTYNVLPENAVMIGNSFKGDIQPALEAGLFGIFIPRGTFQIDGEYSYSPGQYEYLREAELSLDVPLLLKDM